MNLFQLILKQMRQRALSTWLTLLSVLLGVGLATAVLILYRGGGALFGQTSYGYDVLMGPPTGSPLQLVMNTIYQIDQSPGLIPYKVYEDLQTTYRRNVRIAVPYAVGDSYKNHRIVGTLTKLFGVDETGKPIDPDRTLEYKVGQRYSFAQGKVFHAQKFEAVIGSDVTQRTGLKIGDKFKATHGLPQPNETPDEHDVEWTVVGVLNKTFTAADRIIFIPLISFYAITEHEETLQEIAGTPPKPEAHDDHDHDHDHEHAAYKLRDDGTIELLLPKEDWQISAVLVRSRGSVDALTLIRNFKIVDKRAVAVNPASVMREFFDTFFTGTTRLLLIIALLVSIVASVSILVSIYNSVAARMREVAILRALGATRRTILIMICGEAALVGFLGGICGIIVGHALGGAGSWYMHRLIGQGINWLTMGWAELLYLGVVTLIALIAGLVPALKAYRVPVASNLVG